MALGRVTAGLVPRALASGLVRKPLSTLASNSTWSDHRIVSALQHLSLFGSAAVMLYFSEKYSEKYSKERELELKIKHVRELIGEEKPWDALRVIHDMPSGPEKYKLQAEVLDRLALTVSTGPSSSSLKAAIKAAAGDARDHSEASKHLDSPTPIFERGVSALWSGKPKNAKAYFEQSESLCRDRACLEQAKLWRTIAQRVADADGAGAEL